MTERKFTPPTEFPTGYLTSSGHKAVIVAMMPSDTLPYLGYIEDEDGGCHAQGWRTHGGAGNSASSLHDYPEKQVHWANDHRHAYGHRWYETRADADKDAGHDRISVIRREWLRDQTPEYFVEPA